MQEQSKAGKNQKSKDKHSSFDGLIQEDIDLSDIFFAVMGYQTPFYFLDLVVGTGSRQQRCATYKRQYEVFFPLSLLSSGFVVSFAPMGQLLALNLPAGYLPTTYS